MPILGITASSTQQGRTTLVGSYDALASITVGTGGVASVTFAGIPTGYQHLEIRCFAQTNRATYNRDSLPFRFNGDSGTNYSSHGIFGDGGGTPGGSSSTGQTNGSGGTIGTSVENSGLQFGVSMIEILDYASTTKYKTTRAYAGTDMNGAGTGGIGGVVEYMASEWYNASPITSVTLFPGVGTLLNRYSVFSLYGVK